MRENNFLKEAIDNHLEELNYSVAYYNKNRPDEEHKPLKTEKDIRADEWKMIAEYQESSLLAHYGHDFVTEWRAGDDEDDYGLEYELQRVTLRTLDDKDIKLNMYACPTAMRKCYKCGEKIIAYEIFDDLSDQTFDSFDEFAVKHNLPIGWQDEHHWDEAKQLLCPKSKKRSHGEAYDAQPAWYKDELTRADGHFPMPRSDY